MCRSSQVNITSVRLGGLHPSTQGRGSTPKTALAPAGENLAVWFADRRGVLDKVNVTTVYGTYRDTVADKAVCFEAAVPLCRGQ